MPLRIIARLQQAARIALTDVLHVERQGRPLPTQAATLRLIRSGVLRACGPAPLDVCVGDVLRADGSTWRVTSVTHGAAQSHAEAADEAPL